jgi:hypothetical protein
LESIIIELQNLRQKEYTNEYIADFVTSYFGKEVENSTLYMELLKQESQSIIESLNNDINNPSYEIPIKELKNIRKEIDRSQDLLKSVKSEEEREKQNRLVRMLHLQSSILEEDLFKKYAQPKARKRYIETLESLKSENMDRYILFNAIPRDALLYILNYMTNNGNNLWGFCKVSFQSSVLKRLKNLNTEVVMQILTDIGNGSVIRPSLQDWLTPEWDEYIINTLIAPIKGDGKFVKTKREYNQYQEQKQQQQQQLIQQGIKPGQI